MTIDRTGGGGGVTATTFAYDDAGNRVSQTAGTGEEAVTTTYLIDDNNLTGYSQTLEQTDRDYSDAVVKKTTYVVGPDVIGQYVTEGQTTTGAIYLQDAHGSTRGLYDAASAGLCDAASIAAGGSTDQDPDLRRLRQRPGLRPGHGPRPRCCTTARASTPHRPAVPPGPVVRPRRRAVRKPRPVGGGH